MTQVAREVDPICYCLKFFLKNYHHEVFLKAKSCFYRSSSLHLDL